VKKLNINIVFLWAEMPGYVVGLLIELRNKIKGSLDVIYWDKLCVNSTHYNVKNFQEICFHSRSQCNHYTVLYLLKDKRPDIIVVSGWMDKGYIWACRKYKKMVREVKIVAGIDDQWTGSVRQRLGLVYYKVFYRSLFDILWVSGKPQYSYAQRFGYKVDNIISNLYSAETDKFNETANVNTRFVFVGRFVKIKAIDLLIEAYSMLTCEQQKKWPLVLIGDGDQIEIILRTKKSNIQWIPSLQPEELKNELKKGGVGCLTSHKDQWGVVIHEYALMGLPMLLSSGCGAATEYLISGYNGYMFQKGDVKALHRGLAYFCELSKSELRLYSMRSNTLGQRINSEIAAASLLSISII
jgi:glycosyltransferase involved in cell wall biosynthesis